MNTVHIVAASRRDETLSVYSHYETAPRWPRRTHQKERRDGWMEFFLLSIRLICLYRDYKFVESTMFKKCNGSPKVFTALFISVCQSKSIVRDFDCNACEQLKQLKKVHSKQSGAFSVNGFVPAGESAAERKVALYFQVNFKWKLLFHTS